jgi:protein disulfide-isomerase A6
MKPVEFNGPERSASAFFYFATRAVPNKIKKIHQFDDIEKTMKQVCLSRTF